MPSPDSPGVTDRLHAVSGSVSWLLVLRDLVGIVVWVGALSLVFRATGWPTWLYAVVVIGGVLAYSLVAEPWTARPGD